jgi:hypothetical protein
MSNGPFDVLPYNTKRQFVMMKSNGCEIYAPVDCEDDDVIKAAKGVLQGWLDANITPIEPEVA